jgi:hypothetical protein
MLPGTLISENQRSRSVVVRSCGEGRKKPARGRLRDPNLGKWRATKTRRNLVPRVGFNAPVRN